MRIIEDPKLLSAPDLCECGFVPTMGALHAGHGALVERARADGRPVVVSIFVNPTQFGPREDYARYPRTLDADCALLEPLGAAAVFVPSVEAIYPRGLEAARAEAEALALPDVATRPGLEDASRPHHFGGVALVVGRLFDLVRPARAYFGEKDYQQLRLIEDMVAADRGRYGTLEVVPCPTIRERPSPCRARSRSPTRHSASRPPSASCATRSTPTGSRPSTPWCAMRGPCSR
jgi:pantoate--beta-alanine ligase